MTHATQTLDQMRPPYPAEPGAGVYSNKLGMWIFLASDVMFFTALIGSYIVLRFGAPGEWAKPGAVLNVPLTDRGRIPKEISVDLGSGGPTIRATTTNGGVRVARASSM